MGAYVDITGQKFGRLVAIRDTQERKNKRTFWEFLCDCGNIKILEKGNVVSGHTTSCGCVRRENSAELNFKHGMVHTKEYKSFYLIRERCYAERSEKFQMYGGRGMIFEYKDNFIEFLEEVGYMPNDGQRYTIDRIDNTKGYVKGNMRWATDTQQARNKTKKSTNKSGFTGVYKVRTELPSGSYYEAFCATWRSLDGKSKSKNFNIRKLGEDVAFEQACLYRDNMIAFLNLHGAGYSDNHGK